MSIKTHYILTLSAAFLTAAAFTIFAQNANARPSTKAFTCAGVQDYVYARGAMVMSRKRSDLYRRFVAHAGYCRNEGGSTKIFNVPTKSGACRLYICYEREQFKFEGRD